MKMRLNWMGSVILGLVLLGGCAGVVAVDPLSGKDSALVGTWKGTANVGQSLTAVFNADGTYTLSGSGWTNYGTYSTDESQAPRWINVVNQRNETWMGVYEVSGNTLRWGEKKNARPASLEESPYLYTLTKQTTGKN